MKKSNYKEGIESTFTHFGNEYRVDDLIGLANDKRETALKIKDLDWVFVYSQPDPKRVKKASLEFPIIVVKDEVDGEMKYIVLDGLHRLARAKSEGRSYVICKVVTKEEIEKLERVKA